MSKITLTSFALLLLLFFGNSSGIYAAQSKQNTSDAPTGTVQKMIVENGSVSMNLDLNRLNGISSSIDAGVSPADSSYLQPARLPLQAHFEVKLKVGVESFVGSATGVRVVWGGVVSTVNVRLAGVGSTFEAASRARTWNDGVDSAKCSDLSRSAGRVVQSAGN